MVYRTMVERKVGRDSESSIKGKGRERSQLVELEWSKKGWSVDW